MKKKIKDTANIKTEKTDLSAKKIHINKRNTKNKTLISAEKKTDFFNSSEIKIIKHNGKEYIQLVDIAKAFNIDRHLVYNIATVLNRGQNSYLASVSKEKDAPLKKAIQLEALENLIEKLKRKVEENSLLEFVEYVNKEALNLKSDKSEETLLYDIRDDEQILIDSQLSLDLNKVQEDDYIDSKEVINLLDDLVDILDEHNRLVSNVKELRNENQYLTSERNKLMEANSELVRENDRINNVFKEDIKKLQSSLKIEKTANKEIKHKADLIRSYVASNKSLSSSN